MGDATVFIDDHYATFYGSDMSNVRLCDVMPTASLIGCVFRVLSSGLVALTSHILVCPILEYMN